MLGALARAAVGALGAYLVALILEEMLGAFLSVMANAPNGSSSSIYNATAAVQQNFLLLALVGIVVAFVVDAQVESRLGGA